MVVLNGFEYFKNTYSMEMQELQSNLPLISRESVEQAIDLILQCKGKLALSGMGKSGLIAQKLAATFSSTGTPAFFLHPGESLHGDLGVLQPNDLLLVLAKSGESEEVVQMMQIVKKMGLPVISILGKEKSTAGRLSTVIIHAQVSREADSLNLAPTASTTVALVVGDALASAVMALKGFQPENFALFHPAGQLGKRLLLVVDDLLSDSVPVVGPGATMLELLQKESEANLGAVIVVDGSGRMTGIVTDGDIRRSILKYGDIMNREIEDIMTVKPLSIQRGMLAFEALKFMENRPSQISVLPVLDEEQKPIGLLRLHDLVRAGL